MNVHELLQTIFRPVIESKIEFYVLASIEVRGLTTEYFLDSGSKLPSLPTRDVSVGFARTCCGIVLSSVLSSVVGIPSLLFFTTPMRFRAYALYLGFN